MKEFERDDEKILEGIDHFSDHLTRKKPYGKYEGIIVFIFSLLLAIAAFLTVGFLQYDVYDSMVKLRIIHTFDGASFCKIVDLNNFDAVLTPSAAFLLIIFIIIYKRRSLCVKKCSWRNIGLPMIVSMWNKTDRTQTAVIYGRIAYEVFSIVQGVLIPDSSSGVTLPEPDPTGLFKLLMRIIEVILIGIRYYPILVAYRAKSCLIYFFGAIYMWVDLGLTVYQQGKCESIAYDGESSDIRDLVLGYWIGYRVLNIVPTLFLASYLAINLTYRTIATLRNSFNCKRKSKCVLCCINDDYEIIYSHYDILYVLDLFHNKEKNDDELGRNVIIFSNIFRKVTHLEPLYADLEIEITEPEEKKKLNCFQKMKKTIKGIFRKHVYEWNSTFRFTTRFINCHVVAFVALYHVFLLLLYFIIEILIKISANLTLIDLNNLRNLTLGDISCLFGDDFCIEELTYPLPLPEATKKFGPEILPSLQAVAAAPLFIALLFSCIQVFIGIRDAKKHLVEIYKGKCIYLPPVKTLANSSIASSSSHFGGYLVGYLIWGFFIQYIAIVVLGCIIILLRISIGEEIFLKFLLKIVPAICVMIVKRIINLLTSRVIFLRRDTKVLAINNFRAFNVFLYFNFFFDCFMGVISAVIRIIKSVIASIVMMPRIAYSFMGRHLEKMDNGYTSYTGFLYMEAAHTNPIMITFCSILYYKGLSEHVRMIVLNDNFKQKFTGGVKITHKNKLKRKYTKYRVNKWHLLVFLVKNPILLMYRKDNMIGLEKREKPISKIKKCLNVFTKCCKKKETSS